MRGLRTYRIVPLALIACVLISQAACGADKLRTVAKAENITAQSLKSIATLIKSAQDSGEITAAQALALKAPLSEVVQANAMAIQISRAGQLSETSRLPCTANSNPGLRVQVCLPRHFPQQEIRLSGR